MRPKQVAENDRIAPIVLSTAAPVPALEQAPQQHVDAALDIYGDLKAKWEQFPVTTQVLRVAARVPDSGTSDLSSLLWGHWLRRKGQERQRGTQEQDYQAALCKTKYNIFGFFFFFF